MPKPIIAPRSMSKNLAPLPQSSGLPVVVQLDSPPVITSKSSGIITTKEWVLPPRPKPGRKPSVDTPASKRKAQNRAAQRAFRERRATRVQELEAKLMEVEKERDVKEMGLINTINKLKFENQHLLKSIDGLKLELSRWRTGTSPIHLGSNSPTNSIYSVQQISPAPSADSDSPPTSTRRKLKVDDFDCGVCLKDDCLCESVGIKEPTQKLEEQISSFKPMQAVSLKRKSLNVEIDFTKKFKAKKIPEFKKSTEPVAFNEASPVDNCGFCSDDTPCVCREAAKEAALLNESLHNHLEENNDEPVEKTLPPIINNIRKQSLPVMHPGPSVEIRELTNLTPGAVPVVSSNAPSPAPAVSTTKSGCTGNPGTCEQCQMDPMSTLFCTTVASKATESNERSKPNLNSRSNSLVDIGAQFQQAVAAAAKQAPSQTPSQTATPTGGIPSKGIFIPCADAYKTLSRHKKFNSVDFSTLVGKLTTQGMQVEVQSVANVLRELDRRLMD